MMMTCRVGKGAWHGMRGDDRSFPPLPTLSAGAESFDRVGKGARAPLSNRHRATRLCPPYGLTGLDLVSSGNNGG